MEQGDVSILIAGAAHMPGGGAVRVHRAFSEPQCLPRLTDVPGHPLHTDRPLFPPTPPCTHCVPARHLSLARTPVENPRMPGGWAPVDPLLHTPIGPFPTPPASLCHCTARACLPVSHRGGILHSGPNPGNQNLYAPLMAHT